MTAPTLTPEIALKLWLAGPYTWAGWSEPAPVGAARLVKVTTMRDASTRVLPRKDVQQ